MFPDSSYWLLWRSWVQSPVRPLRLEFPFERAALSGPPLWFHCINLSRCVVVIKRCCSRHRGCRLAVAAATAMLVVV